MLRIAILENEEAAKNIMFSLAQYLQEEDCCFYCFKKISQFAKAEAEKEFHVVIFHEKMEVPRITQSFVLRKPQRIIIYTADSSVFTYILCGTQTSPIRDGENSSSYAKASPQSG